MLRRPTRSTLFPYTTLFRSTPTAISIFVCLSMVQLMAVFISMRCTLCGHFLQFLFSSRRRHTSLQGDWSSDVCSSDLHIVDDMVDKSHLPGALCGDAGAGDGVQIGRASCRERVWISEGGVSFNKMHFMRKLPTCSVDPNFGRRVRNRRQLNSLQDTWPYSYSMPIAVRYTQDAFSRSGWLWPVDAKGEPLKATSYMAVGFYVAKYVNKKSDMDLAAKGLGAKEWNNSLKTKLSLLPKKLFRIRMSRNFGMKMLTMTNLSTECLIQLTKLGYDATPFNQIL